MKEEDREKGKEEDKLAAILPSLTETEIRIFDMIKRSMKPFLSLWWNTYKQS